MKRYIKDYRTITDEHMMLIRSQYPNGFSDDDLVALKTSNGDYFDALEVRTDDALYIVRVNHDLLEMISDFENKMSLEDVSDDFELAGEEE
jgi:hypothetical protein